MTPEKGQHVKCFMRSTMVLEGIVEEWSDVQVVLKSLADQSVLIIHRPSEDIAVTKVVLEEPQEKSIEKPKLELPEIKQAVKEKLEEVLNPTDDAELAKMNVQQLRQLVVEQEKKIISDKIKEHFGSPSAPRRSAYAPSGNIAILAAKQEANILRKHFGRKK
jgi:hypothetical protein